MRRKVVALFIASSPHAHNHEAPRSHEMESLFVHCQGLLAQTYFFGWGTLIQLVFAIALAVTFEAAVMLLRKRRQ
ncbi:RnfABCDGE type electron transport complex subunit D [Vibrio lentus]|nr:RnfABCDGE type electron transport complex subunit D [Vibrio lentus]